MSPELYTRIPGVKLDFPSNYRHAGMGGHLIALEKCVQRMQEAVRQALKRHDTFQVHLLDVDLTRTRRVWEVLCGLSDVPDAA
ncbi:hypothetical protein ACIQVO_00130 [Streptomyces sp. NPDC101062]|uniref:hypothetical protein n=1 Tax=unclassified Streptomyces TaxID=2593676 RepID=UPI00382F1AC7